MDLTTKCSPIKEDQCTETMDRIETSGHDTVQELTEVPENYPISETRPILKHEYDTFQSWASRNYGETSKTKTVTKRKYNRIKSTLIGDELPCSENAKFRFWIKAKGFKLGPSSWRTGDPDTRQVLYVPTKVQTPHGTIKEFKRVAIVDDFYDIIYSMHVDPDSKGGKHAGQKRTYRAIAETYAFLPREAVTRFLMSCSDCQKRMHLSPESLSNREKHSISSPTSSPGHGEQEENSNSAVGDADLEASLLNFNVPITTTYLNHIKKKKLSQEESEQGTTVQDLSTTSEEDLIDLSPRRSGNQICIEAFQKDSPGKQKRLSYKKNQMSSPVGRFNSSASKHGKYIAKLKSNVGAGCLIAAQNNTLPSESSVSPRTANLYKPYETVSHRSMDMSRPMTNSNTLSPQPASTAGNTATQEMSQSSHPLPGCHTGDMAHYIAKKGYPNHPLYVHTEGDHIPSGSYNNTASDQTSRVKTEDPTNEPTNLSMKLADRERPTTAFSYMNRYITGAKTGLPDQEQVNMKLLTIKQLILGYRESAAFLYRSAQELEQLLLKYS